MEGYWKKNGLVGRKIERLVRMLRISYVDLPCYLWTKDNFQDFISVILDTGKFNSRIFKEMDGRDYFRICSMRNEEEQESAFRKMLGEVKTMEEKDVEIIVKDLLVSVRRMKENDYYFSTWSAIFFEKYKNEAEKYPNKNDLNPPEHLEDAPKTIERFFNTALIKLEKENENLKDKDAMEFHIWSYERNIWGSPSLEIGIGSISINFSPSSICRAYYDESPLKPPKRENSEKVIDFREKEYIGSILVRKENIPDLSEAIAEEIGLFSSHVYRGDIPSKTEVEEKNINNESKSKKEIKIHDAFDIIEGRTNCIVVDHEEVVLKKKICEGSSTQLYLAKLSTNGIMVAVKLTTSSHQLTNRSSLSNELNRDDDQIFDDFAKEISILSGLGRYPYIVRMFGYYCLKNRFGIVYGYCRIDLRNYIKLMNQDDTQKKSLSVREKRRILYEIANAMKYVHSRDIYHRDLKLGHILLDEQNTVRVTGFGACKVIDEEAKMNDRRYSMKIGDSPYMAPELIFHELGRYDEKVDVYSFGCIMFCVMGNKTSPWDDNLTWSTIENKVSTDPHFRPSLDEIRKNMEEECSTKHERIIYRSLTSLTALCWNHNRKKRPSFSKLCEMLEKYEELGFEEEEEGEASSSPSPKKKKKRSRLYFREKNGMIWLKENLRGRKGDIKGDIESRVFVDYFSEYLLSLGIKTKTTKKKKNISQLEAILTLRKMKAFWESLNEDHRNSSFLLQMLHERKLPRIPTCLYHKNIYYSDPYQFLSLLAIRRSPISYIFVSDEHFMHDQSKEEEEEKRRRKRKEFDELAILENNEVIFLLEDSVKFDPKNIFLLNDLSRRRRRVSKNVELVEEISFDNLYGEEDEGEEEEEEQEDEEDDSERIFDMSTFASSSYLPTTEPFDFMNLMTHVFSSAGRSHEDLEFLSRIICEHPECIFLLQKDEVLWKKNNGALGSSFMTSLIKNNFSCLSDNSYPSRCGDTIQGENDFFTRIRSRRRKGRKSTRVQRFYKLCSYLSNLGVSNFTSYEPINDPNIVKEMVSVDGNMLKYANDTIRNENKEVVMEALRRNGLSVRFLSCQPKMYQDGDVMKQAEEEHPFSIFFSFRFISELLRTVSSKLYYKYILGSEGPIKFNTLEDKLEEEEEEIIINQIIIPTLLKILPEDKPVPNLKEILAKRENQRSSEETERQKQKRERDRFLKITVSAHMCKKRINRTKYVIRDFFFHSLKKGRSRSEVKNLEGTSKTRRRTGDMLTFDPFRLEGMEDEEITKDRSGGVWWEIFRFVTCLGWYLLGKGSGMGTSGFKGKCLDFVRSRIQQNGLFLQYVPEKMRKPDPSVLPRSLMIEAITRTPTSLLFVQNDLRNDCQVLDLLLTDVNLRRIEHLFAYLGSTARKDYFDPLTYPDHLLFEEGFSSSSDYSKRIIESIYSKNKNKKIENNSNQQAYNVEVPSNEIDRSSNLEIRRRLFFYLSNERILSDRSLMMEVMKDDPHLFPHLSHELRNDRDIVISVLGNTRDLALAKKMIPFVSGDILQNHDVVRQIVSKNGSMIEYLAHFDYFGLKAAIQQNPVSIKFVDPQNSSFSPPGEEKDGEARQQQYELFKTLIDSCRSKLEHVKTKIEEYLDIKKFIDDDDEDNNNNNTKEMDQSFLQKDFVKDCFNILIISHLQMWMMNKEENFEDFESAFRCLIEFYHMEKVCQNHGFISSSLNSLSNEVDGWEATQHEVHPRLMQVQKMENETDFLLLFQSVLSKRAETMQEINNFWKILYSEENLLFSAPPSPKKEDHRHASIGSENTLQMIHLALRSSNRRSKNPRVKKKNPYQTLNTWGESWSRDFTRFLFLLCPEKFRRWNWVEDKKTVSFFKKSNVEKTEKEIAVFRTSIMNNFATTLLHEYLEEMNLMKHEAYAQDIIKFVRRHCVEKFEFGLSRIQVRGDTPIVRNHTDQRRRFFFGVARRSQDSQSAISQQRAPNSDVQPSGADILDDTIEEYEMEGHGLIFLLKSKLFSKNVFQRLFQGFFTNGLLEGEGRGFDEKNGYLSFHGLFSKGLKHGKGMEYIFQKELGNVRSTFEGSFRFGKRHGRAEFLDIKKGYVMKGNFVDGKLDQNSVSKFVLPVIPYHSIQKYLKNDKLLGQGAFGSVYEVKASSMSLKVKDQKSVAVKIMKIVNPLHRDKMFRMVRRSVGLLSSLSSESILEIYAIIEGSKQVGYVMRLCKTSIDKLIAKDRSESSGTGVMEIEEEEEEKYDDGEELFMKWGMKEKMRILTQTCGGMVALHSKSVMHRDLKWPNVMIDFEGNVKITDFDTLKEDEIQWRFQSVAQSSRIGTPGFLAPDVFLGKDFTLKCDVYAFGLMIYSILWGLNVPFSTQYQCTCGQLMNQIFLSNSLDYHVANCNLRPALDPKEVRKYPEFLIDLMIQCWDKNPFNRPSFKEILLRLKLEKIKSFVSIVFRVFCGSSDTSSQQADKNIVISQQKMYLVKPFEVKRITEWIEEKFEGSKVMKIIHNVLGTIEKDQDLSRLLDKESQPSLDVFLDRVNKSLVVPSFFSSSSSFEKKKNLEQEKKLKKFEDDIGLLRSEKEELWEMNEEKEIEVEKLKLEILELKKKVENLEEENKILRSKE